MTKGDKVIALIVTAWLALSVGFLLGAMWATRRPEPKPPQPPIQLTRVDWRAYNHDRARQELLDMLERGKW